MTKTALRFLFFGIITVYLSACYYDNVDEVHPRLNEVCDTNNVVITYAETIAPIMQSSCGSQNVTCHSSNATSQVPLNTYQDVRDQADNGTLMSSITHDGNATNMPLGGGQISECKINSIQAWINRNYPQ